MEKSGTRTPRAIAPAASRVAIAAALLKERRYLSGFFAKLAEADVVFVSEVEQLTEEELFKIAPTSNSNRQRFMRYVRAGLIELRPS